MSEKALTRLDFKADPAGLPPAEAGAGKVTLAWLGLSHVQGKAGAATPSALDELRKE